MCGRFTITLTNKELDKYLYDHYQINNQSAFQIPNYNVAPGQDVITVIFDKTYRVGTIKWGFISLVNSIPLINARSETVFELPSYKEAIRRGRCVVLADSYYEWDLDPYRIKSGEVLKMAGLYSVIKQGDQKTATVLLLTTKASPPIAHIHDRMPVLLTKEEEALWLNPNTTANQLKPMLKPYQGVLTHYPVSRRVNYIKNNDIDLIKEVERQSLFE